MRRGNKQPILRSPAQAPRGGGRPGPAAAPALNRNSIPRDVDEQDVPGQLFPISQLPGRSWMPRPRGQPISLWTVIRWSTAGKHGHKLKTLMVGGTRCTTDMWALQFFEQLSSVDAAPAAT